MVDEACQVTTGLGSVVGRKVSLHGLQLTIEAGLDTLGRQVKAVDQVDQITDLLRRPLDMHREALRAGGESIRVRGRTAARFLEGQRTIELLSMAISGDLAYTVWIERGETRVVGSDELRPSGLRVTHIFRREEGAWKIIHRHADAIMQKIEATAILQP
jgi:ketosteroid isomerase-like protein